VALGRNVKNVGQVGLSGMAMWPAIIPPASRRLIAGLSRESNLFDEIQEQIRPGGAWTGHPASASFPGGCLHGDSKITALASSSLVKSARLGRPPVQLGF
jgi:hypothetical protein